MIIFLSSFTNTNGLGFPDTLGINASGPSAQDGTEFVKLFVDNEWGAAQALLDYAGLTPDGVTEAPGTAQTIEAIQKGFAVGPGFGVEYWKDGDPAVNGDRVLLLNGQGVLRATYLELDAAVYVGDGNNGTASKFYHADDSAGVTRNIAGVYLILPETRGYALRGLDTAASVDPDGASRDMGSIQVDAMQKITGTAQRNATSGITNGSVGDLTGVFTNGAGLASQSGVLASAGFAINFDNSLSISPNAAKTNDIETRMANIAVRYGITY